MKPTRKIAEESISEDFEVLASMFLKHRGGEGATEEELMVVYDELHRARTLGVLIDGTLRGRFTIDVTDGEVRYSVPDTPSTPAPKLTHV